MMMSGKPSEIPSKDDFDALSKLERKIFLETLRREFSDKDIREKWNLKPQSFYQMISRFGLGRQYRKSTDEPTEKRGPGRPPQKPVEPADDERVIIDADYTVMPDGDVRDIKPMLDRIGYFDKVKEKAQPVDFPFPIIKGTPAQLRKQLEAVAMFLEGNESEDTSFEILLSVVKK